MLIVDVQNFFEGLPLRAGSADLHNLEATESAICALVPSLVRDAVVAPILRSAVEQGMSVEDVASATGYPVHVVRDLADDGFDP